MPFETPTAAALGYRDLPPDVEVLALAEAEFHAGVVLTAPGWAQPEVVLCHRDADGWEPHSMGSGGTHWSLTDEASNTGVMIDWGKAESGGLAYDVTFQGATRRVPVTNGHYIWIVENVTDDALDEPAEFVPVT